METWIASRRGGHRQRDQHSGSGFRVIALSILLSACREAGAQGTDPDPAPVDSEVAAEDGPSDLFDPAESNLDAQLIGSWSANNIGTNATGTITIAADGTYRIDAGEVAGADNPTAGAKAGSYFVRGRLIGFRNASWSLPLPVSRFGLVLSASSQEITYHVLGHTHDVVVLTRTTQDPR